MYLSCGCLFGHFLDRNGLVVAVHAQAKFGGQRLLGVGVGRHVNGGRGRAVRRGGVAIGLLKGVVVGRVEMHGAHHLGLDERAWRETG